MSAPRRTLAALIALSTVLAASPARTATTLDRSVIGSAAVSTAAGPISLTATMGQFAVGLVTAGVHTVGFGFWAGGVSAPVSDVPGEELAAGPVPERSRQLAPRPNPLRSRTVVAFEIASPDAQLVSLQIFSTSGRLVRTLLREDLPSGRHEVEWDGCDQGGKPVPSGVYFSRLTVGNVRDVRKLEVIR